MGSVHKVKFLDEHKEHYMLENSALRSKLQSKVEALQIIAKDLDKCRSERDQFKLMAEQLQERYTLLKKKSFEFDGSNRTYDERIDYSKLPGQSVAQLLNDTREQNKALTLDTESLRQKLSEAQGDIIVLRKQLHNLKFNNIVYNDAQLFPSHQREELVEQLEKSNLKITQLQTDLQAMLEDKEELIKERDSYKCKVHRLNHELTVLLKAENNPLLDGDGLITENRYLHERLQQAEDENNLMGQALAKYKSMLETKRQKGAIKLGTNNPDMVMSHKQAMKKELILKFITGYKILVKRLLEDGTSTELPVTPATISDLKSLCLGLLESLNDKSLALAHQKKANRILAARIQDLEQRLENGVNLSVFPSQILLENYCSADVDLQETSETQELNEDNIEDKAEIDDIIKVEVLEEPTEKDEILLEEEMSKLPPQLQKLVDQAMQDLKTQNGV